MDGQNKWHGLEDTWINTENLNRYNQTVNQLNMVARDISETSPPLIITLFKSVIELLWSVKAWATGRFLRPGYPMNLLQESRKAIILARQFPVLTLI